MKLNSEHEAASPPEPDFALCHAILLKRSTAYAAAWAKCAHVRPELRTLAFAQLWFRLATTFSGAVVEMLDAKHEE